jgi:hypothetical protein
MDVANRLNARLAEARRQVTTLDRALRYASALPAYLPGRLDRLLGTYGDVEMYQHLTRASSLDRDIAISMDMPHDIGLATVCDHALVITRTLARVRNRVAEIAEASTAAFGAPEVHEALGLDVRMPAAPPPTGRGRGVPGITRRADALAAVMGKALGGAIVAGLHQTADSPGKDDLATRFATNLVSQQLLDTKALSVDLDAMAATARTACRSDTFAKSPRTTAIAHRLEDVAWAVFTRRQPLDAATATRIRLPALALAGEALPAHPQLAVDLRSVAAATTLMQLRTLKAMRLEQLILARA